MARTIKQEEELFNIEVDVTEELILTSKYGLLLRVLQLIVVGICSITPDRRKQGLERWVWTTFVVSDFLFLLFCHFKLNETKGSCKIWARTVLITYIMICFA